MTELSKEAFVEILGQDMPVVVDFWAEWCMPCKIFAPVVEELSAELDGKAVFGKLDVEEHQALAIEYSVTNIPTLVIFKDGEEKERLVGVKQKAEVLAAVEKYM